METVLELGSHLVPDKWTQPRDLYFTVVLCSIAAAVQ